MRPFTAGPWKAVQHNDGRHIIITDTISDPMQTYLSIALAEIPHNLGGYESERQANATLMATAPELYGALLSVIHLMEIYRDEIRLPKDRRILNVAYLKAVNAVMHARGEVNAETS